MAQAGENTHESHQIATLANGAISSINDLISSLASDEARCSKATFQLTRFKLWAGSIGAHRQSGHRSLDYLLRDASFIREYVIKLLEQLGGAIEDASSISSHHVAPVHEVHDSLEPGLIEYLVDDDESFQLDLDLALANVSHVVGCLLRLSVTIRNPAPHDQFMSRAREETMVALIEPYDIRHVLEKFPRIESELVERLGRAVTNRRHFFKYREDEHTRTASGIDHDDGLEEGGDQTTVLSSVPGNLKDAVKEHPVIDADEVDPRKAYGPCPLCAEVQITSKTHYYKHVGYHLEQLSVFSLPQIVSGNDENRSQKDSVEENDQKLDVVENATERQGNKEGRIDSAMEKLNIDDSLGLPLTSNLDDEEDAKDKVFGGSGGRAVADSSRTPLEEAHQVPRSGEQQSPERARLFQSGEIKRNPDPSAWEWNATVTGAIYQTITMNFVLRVVIAETLIAMPGDRIANNLDAIYPNRKFNVGGSILWGV
ncbi:hypothetical protein E0Z10_g7669 [Xylaria hypoxylon]|uniref:Uncharacterized protein n=1 Tax=Xylaria hypoxylon TaxID=37992 RepID=A0A4Z0YXI8_9PEZI|nr:hypothetical protein E0Z10_g7669 [Xylaria hypoxylon]